MLQGIFSIFNTKTDKKIEISSIILKRFKKQKIVDIKTELSEIHYNPINFDTIKINTLTLKSISYQINGKIISGKDFISSIEKIEITKEKKQGKFYIKHIIKINQTQREINNHISMYSYNKDCDVDLPKEINSIIFVVFLELHNASQIPIRNLIYEKTINL